MANIRPNIRQQDTSLVQNCNAFRNVTSLNWVEKTKTYLSTYHSKHWKYIKNPILSFPFRLILSRITGQLFWYYWEFVGIRYNDFFPLAFFAVNFRCILSQRILNNIKKVDRWSSRESVKKEMIIWGFWYIFSVSNDKWTNMFSFSPLIWVSVTILTRYSCERD